MRQKLINSIREQILELSEQDSGLIVDKFCRIKEPEFKPPPIQYITLDSTKNTGSSIKPGNILLNMRKLLIDSSEIGLTVAGVIATPYLIPLAALIVWNKVWSNIKVDLTEEHAMTIKLMWENRDTERNWIEERTIFKLYNEYLKSKNRNIILIEDFQKILSDLERMKCVEKSGEDNWWLREWVRKEI